MSHFTYQSWQKFVDELIDSRANHVCGTREPFWVVQERKRQYGFSEDYSSKSVWVVDGESIFQTSGDLYESLSAEERHDINSFALASHDLLFSDLDGDTSAQDKLLGEYVEEENLDWKVVFYKEEWQDVNVFLSHQDASRFIERQSHNYSELRIFVKSIWDSPHLCNLINAIASGELKLVLAE